MRASAKTAAISLETSGVAKRIGWTELFRDRMEVSNVSLRHWAPTATLISPPGRIHKGPSARILAEADWLRSRASL
ncbi:hypothetical protein D3C77_355600 [compost metagenome]